MIGPEDEVYHLGDVMLNDNEHGLECIKKLNGKIHILIGNHDTDTRIELYKTCPNIVSIDYAKEIKIGKYYFWLCHYPTITANYDDDKPWAKHLINIYGHTHQQTNFLNDSPLNYHAGVDSHDCKPIDAWMIITEIEDKANECMELL